MYDYSHHPNGPDALDDNEPCYNEGSECDGTVERCAGTCGNEYCAEHSVIYRDYSQGKPGKPRQIMLCVGDSETRGCADYRQFRDVHHDCEAYQKRVYEKAQEAKIVYDAELWRAPRAA